MPLTYDLTAIKDRDMSDAGWLSTQAVIYHSMTCKMWQLTDENASEWYARIHFCEAVLGETMLREKGAPYCLTPQEIRANIGVSTNEGHMYDRKDWIRQVVARHNAWVERWGKDIPASDRNRKYTYAEVRDALSTYADEYLEAIS